MVRGTAPLVSIHNPRNANELSGAKGLVLDGSATDIDDGRLTGQALVWTSSLSGILGTGEEVILDPGSLTPGKHQITLKATDSSGSVGLDTVEVTVIK